jgi:transposase
MLKVEEIEQIRQAYYRGEKSIRQIAKEQHHGRQVVREALQDAGPREYHQLQPRPSPVVGPFIPIIEQWLREDQQRPKKQRHTAHRIWKRLQEEHQFPGAESTIRRYVREHRAVSAGARAEAAMIPLAFRSGEDAQADFGEAQVIMAGKLITTHFCAVRLCYSKLPFLIAFPPERQEAFLEGLARGCEFFEGVPARLTVDNATTLVRRILEGHNRQEQEGFIAFRSHYVFASHFCTPGEAHEKGKVENLIGTSRRACFVPLPQVASYAELNAHLRTYCEKQKERRLRGETKTIGELWQEEKIRLRPLPATAYVVGRLVPAVVSRSATVQFETNRYSVPAMYQKREVLIRASVWQVEILAERGTTMIAAHSRSYEREQDILDPRHYLGLLAHRPGALEHCKAIQQWEREGRWPQVFGKYLTALRAAHLEGGLAATKEYVRILALYAEPMGAALPEVLEKALALRCFSLEAVKLLLHQHRQPNSSPLPLDLAARPHLASLASSCPPPPDLEVYDRLLSDRVLTAVLPCAILGGGR